MGGEEAADLGRGMADWGGRVVEGWEQEYRPSSEPQEATDVAQAAGVAAQERDRGAGDELVDEEPLALGEERILEEGRAEEVASSMLEKCFQRLQGTEVREKEAEVPCLLAERLLLEAKVFVWKGELRALALEPLAQEPRAGEVEFQAWEAEPRAWEAESRAREVEFQAGEVEPRAWEVEFQA